jgi:hypothetical protein
VDRGGRLRRARAEIAKAVSNVLRGFSLCAPVLLLDAPATLAESVESAAPAVDIPAQALSQALEAFARQTGLQLVYVSGIVVNKRSHAVSAGLNASETLARLLKGTGLRFEYLTPDTIRILPATPPDRRSRTASARRRIHPARRCSDTRYRAIPPMMRRSAWRGTTGPRSSPAATCSIPMQSRTSRPGSLSRRRFHFVHAS